MLIALTLREEKRLLASNKDPMEHKKAKGGLKGVPTREQTSDMKKNLKKRAKAGIQVSNLLEFNNLTKGCLLPPSLNKALTLSTANTGHGAIVQSGGIMSVPQVRSRVRICLVSFQYSTRYPCAYPCAYPHSHTDPSACVRALRMPSHMMWKALASLVACRSNGLASWSKDRVNLFFTLMASINFTTEDGSSFPLALITFGVCFLMRIFARIPHVYPCAYPCV